MSLTRHIRCMCGFEFCINCGEDDDDCWCDMRKEVPYKLRERWKKGHPIPLALVYVDQNSTSMKRHRLAVCDLAIDSDARLIGIRSEARILLTFISSLKLAANLSWSRCCSIHIMDWWWVRELIWLSSFKCCQLLFGIQQGLQKERQDCWC